MKILTILGARPQFMKAGSFSSGIAKYNEIEEITLHSLINYVDALPVKMFELI